MKKRATYLFLFILILVPILSSISCDQSPNYVVNTSELCGCDTILEGPCAKIAGNWKTTANELLEVSAIDPSNGGQIFKQCQAESGFWHKNKWRPVDGRKHNMSGTLHRFDWNYYDDQDWNMYIVPSPFYSFIIDDVKTVYEDSESYDCGGAPCMVNEISPDTGLWTNPWFYAPNVHPQDSDGTGFSWLEGKQMGFYGPWIADANHEFHPEIHPAEMMWYRDRHTGAAPYDVFWLFFMQDNTGRFDDEDNFDCDGNRPPGWKPWTHSPLSGQFNIAFEVDPTREVANFFIREHSQRWVVTSEDGNASADADDGTSHGLEVNNRVVVRVEEQQLNDDDLGVTFTNLCMGSDGKLRGFVSIRSKVGGNDDRDEEGFHILYVTRSLTSGRPDVTNPGTVVGPALFLAGKEIANSLNGGGDHFTGNLQLTLVGNERAAERDYEITKIEFAGGDVRRELKFDQYKGAKEVLVQDLPLIGNGKLIVTSASGLASTFPVRGLSPLPSIDQTVTRSTIDAEAGKLLWSAVGGVAGVPLPSNKKLSALNELEVRFRPGYSLYNGKEPMTDSQSSFANELNEAVAKKDRQKLQRLFNSAEPFNVSWTFEAMDVASGKSVPVYTPESAVAGGGGVQVQTTSTDWANDTLKIKFPSTGATGIVELRAKASVTDKKGKTAVVEHRVWSHGFQSVDKNVDGWRLLVQALSGVRDRSLLYAGDPVRKPKVFDIMPDRKNVRAELIDAYLRDTLRDRQVTIAELRNVIRALKKFSAV